MDRVGCYTTARVTHGRLERLERHAGRLRRDAHRLGLPLPERAAIEAIALAAAREELGRGDGIVRIEWSRGAHASAPALFATTRALGPDAPTWRAIHARAIHPGANAGLGTKALGIAAWAAARAEAATARVDEALLFDAAGRLIEGSRTNVVVVTEDDRWLTPTQSLGGVEGLGLACLREAVSGIVESPALDRGALAAAREVVAVNAVRGAVGIVEIDGRPVGDGTLGPRARAWRGFFFRPPR